MTTRTAQTLLFLLVVANGFFADMAYGAQDPRWNLPVSPVLVLIAAVAARTIYLAQPPVGGVRVATLLVLAAGALVPSSLVAWTSLFAASTLGILCDRQRILTHQLPLALAVTQMWKAVGFKVLASPIVAVEASILGTLLNVIGFDAEVTGNVIKITPEHSLILLAGCSALSDLGVILLGWTAVFMLVRPGIQVPVWRLAVVGGATVVLNLLRLVLMSLNQDWYDLVHNGLGAQLYDAALCALVISAGMYYPEFDQATDGAGASTRVAAKPAPATSPAELSRYGHPAMVAVLAMLAVASLSLKWVRYSEDDVSGWIEAQARLKDAITTAGFTFVSSVPLTADGAIEGLMFEKAGCENPLYVSLLSASGGTEQVLSRYLHGAPIAIVLDGKIVDRWPMLQFVAANAVGVAQQLLSGDRAVLRPLVSVSPPPMHASGCSWPTYPVAAASLAGSKPPG